MSSNILAVYLGNLRQDYKENKLEENILELFQNYLNIQLKNEDIKIKNCENEKCYYARVRLQSVDDQENALWRLGSRENRSRLGYKFHLKLVKQREPLSVADDDQQNLFPIQVPLAGKFYHLNDHVGEETRDTEFKKGGGDYLNKNLKDHIAKYLSAFLNSKVKGTLFIGVKDDGRVEGVELADEEVDKWRLSIDKYVTNIKPTVWPELYQVKFVPVLCKGNRRKVIEITVDGKKADHNELYSSKYEVFVRRDGSVQKLPYPDIQKWNNENKNEQTILQDRLVTVSGELQTMSGELQTMSGELQELMTQHKQEQKTISETMEAQREQIQLLNEKLNKKPKSKICSIV